MLKILYEDNHLLVVEKPANMPMQQDASHDLDLLTSAKEYLIAKYHKPGDAYVGMVQRLDRPVGGVVVLAKTSKAAQRLNRQIQNHEVHKKYLAVIDKGDIPDQGHLIDHLIKDHHTNTVKVSPRGKEAILDYRLIKTKDGLSLVEVELLTGRSHQIRVQFASRKMPLYGDQRYNPKAVKGQQIALWSHQLTIRHPVSNESLTFTSFIDRYPFNL